MGRDQVTASIHCADPSCVTLPPPLIWVLQLLVLVVPVSPGGRGGDGYVTYVPPRKLHGRIPVDIGQQAQAEAL